MARTTIYYSCGHTGEKQLFGKMSQRESYVEYAAKSLVCPACAREAQDKESAEYEASESLPELIGSEKQVSWARTIRIKMLKEFDEKVAYHRSIAPPERLEEIDKAIHAINQTVRGRKRASWWIDNQRAGGTYLIEKEYAAYKAAQGAQDK